MKISKTYITMRRIDVGEFKPADEFVVEAMMRDGKFKVIGKVLTKNNLLNDDDLETIHDFANRGVNGHELGMVSNGIYAGMDADSDGKMAYVIFDSGVSVVNNNVMVRKHYDVSNGYYIKSGRLHKEQSRDVWCYGSRETIMSEYKSNPFICGKV